MNNLLIENINRTLKYRTMNNNSIRFINITNNLYLTEIKNNLYNNKFKLKFYNKNNRR